MRDAPRDGLYRMVETARGKLDVRADDDGRPLLVGYPIVYNKWTEIKGWEGHFMERISPGAPARHLKTHADRIKVLFNHGMDVIGRMPLGKPRAIVDRKKGLWTETPLDPTSYNDDLAVSIRSGAIDGMSFQFTVSREDWKDEPKTSDRNPKGIPERTIRELKLYEFGPVTFPAYQATEVGLRGRLAFEAFANTPNFGTLTLADDGMSISNNGEVEFHHDAQATRLPSVNSKDVARLARAVAHSLKEPQYEGTTRPPG